MRRTRTWLLLVALTACGSPMQGADAAIDDAATPVDAALDTGACTLQPGDLPGMRSIAAGALLPDMTFTTATGSVSLTDYHVPCAPQAELIVVRSLAAWSGHSRWQVAHTARLLSHPQRARLHFIDVVVAGADALPATQSDLTELAPLYDMVPDAVAMDPEERFAPVALGGIRLPIVLIIDARDLRLVRPLYAPRAGYIESTIDATLARLDGLPPPGPFNPTLTDGRFSEDEWDLVQDMARVAPPADPSNAHADDPAAATLGAALFADTGLSPASVACATCHDATMGYGDGRETGHGVSDVTRNTPTIYGIGFVRWPFWDGRVDSPWAQALGPSENPREMGSSRLAIAHRIAAAHLAGYEAVFGTLPDISDRARFPAAGRPGDAAWDGMAAADQHLIDVVFTNAGKAIEAYERTITPPMTRFDTYVGGDASALTTVERDGLHEFVQDGCADCHWGPNLSNGAFHDIGMPGFGTGTELDVGRMTAFDVLVASPFRRQGAFSDDPTARDPLAGLTMFDASSRGAFRTPTLRAIGATGPWGHAGTFATLRDVVVHYANIRMPVTTPDPRVVGPVDPHVVGFDNISSRVDPITAFLMTL